MDGKREEREREREKRENEGIWERMKDLTADIFHQKKNKTTQGNFCHRKRKRRQLSIASKIEEKFDNQLFVDPSSSSSTLMVPPGNQESASARNSLKRSFPPFNNFPPTYFWLNWFPVIGQAAAAAASDHHNENPSSGSDTLNEKFLSQGPVRKSFNK